MGDAELQEASATTRAVVGFSAYLHGIGYSVEQFVQELDAAVQHVKAQMQQQPG